MFPLFIVNTNEIITTCKLDINLIINIIYSDDWIDKIKEIKEYNLKILSHLKHPYYNDRSNNLIINSEINRIVYNSTSRFIDLNYLIDKDKCIKIYSRAYDLLKNEILYGPGSIFKYIKEDSKANIELYLKYYSSQLNIDIYFFEALESAININKLELVDLIFNKTGTMISKLITPTYKNNLVIKYIYSKYQDGLITFYKTYQPIYNILRNRHIISPGIDLFN